MPIWSVHWVLIWLNLSTSSPVPLPASLLLCLQLPGFTTPASDWLTSARLACLFMHARLIISPWPWIYAAPSTFTPIVFISIPHIPLSRDESFLFPSAQYWHIPIEKSPICNISPYLAIYGTTKTLQNCIQVTHGHKTANHGFLVGVKITSVFVFYRIMSQLIDFRWLGLWWCILCGCGWVSED